MCLIPPLPSATCSCAQGTTSASVIGPHSSLSCSSSLPMPTRSQCSSLSPYRPPQSLQSTLPSFQPPIGDLPPNLHLWLLLFPVLMYLISHLLDISSPSHSPYCLSGLLGSQSPLVLSAPPCLAHVSIRPLLPRVSPGRHSSMKKGF